MNWQLAIPEVGGQQYQNFCYKHYQSLTKISKDTMRQNNRKTEKLEEFYYCKYLVIMEKEHDSLLCLLVFKIVHINNK